MANILKKIKNPFRRDEREPTRELHGDGGDEGSRKRGIEKARRVITSREVEKANARLIEFKSAKEKLDARLIENEEYFRLRHWEQIRRERSASSHEGDTVGAKQEAVEPTSGWLLGSIKNKHADAMDNFPRANILPREEGDRMEAFRLTAIVPSILDYIGFEKVYNDVMWCKHKQGTGVYCVYWDRQADGGVGEIGVKKVDLLNLYWEPGCDDIQESSDLFLVKQMDVRTVERNHPELRGKLNTSDAIARRYEDQPSGSRSRRVAVVDWYYKKQVNGHTVLHYCQYVGDHVIYATENDAATAERGLYDHGKYPFVFDVLLPMEGQPVGFGEIDVGKSKQAYIDILNQAILKNCLWAANPRFFVPKGAGVNREQFMDLRQTLVEYAGSSDGIVPITTTPVQGNVVAMLEMTINELKETTGARDVATGGTTSGVTAASAIAAMQEASGKTSRDANRASFRAFRSIVEMMIELIRQFYTAPHYFRICGDGHEIFTRYTNEGLNYREVRDETGAVVREARHPLFDLEITTEKNSAYSRMAQNELSLQFYNAGFYQPSNAPAALACLEMMDFDRKSDMVSRISENNFLQQQAVGGYRQAYMLAAELDRKNAILAEMGAGKPTNYAAKIGQELQAMGVSESPSSASASGAGGRATGDAAGGESHITKNARERAAEVSSPV